jgi:hypothetical protein
MRLFSINLSLWIVFSSATLLSPVARSEYRIYKLGIKYSDKQKKEIEVLTTLDDQQYRTYYQQTASQQTRLIDHWMCKGRTDLFRKPCAAPIKRVVKASPPPTLSPVAQPPKPQVATNDSSPPQAPPPSNPIMLQ